MAERGGAGCGPVPGCMIRWAACRMIIIVVRQMRAEPCSLFHSFDIVCDMCARVVCTAALVRLMQCMFVHECSTVTMTWAGQFHDILVSDMLAVASLITEFW